MPTPSLIKPTHKSLAEYHATLAQLAEQNATTEGNLRRAFSHLLATTAKLHDWTLVEEDTRAPSTAPGTAIRTDGTLYDRNRLPRRYWEAKDASDNLTAEIRKKKARGYSLMNTIFEDTRTAVLFQNNREVQRADLANPEQLSGLLNAFYAHTEPDFQHWEEAVEDFKDRVPELARGLVSIVESAHKTNTTFQKAFADFFTCASSVRTFLITFRRFCNDSLHGRSACVYDARLDKVAA